MATLIALHFYVLFTSFTNYIKNNSLLTYIFISIRKFLLVDYFVMLRSLTMWGCSTCKPTLKRKGCMNVGAFVLYSFYVTFSKWDFFNAAFPKITVRNLQIDQ